MKSSPFYFNTINEIKISEIKEIFSSYPQDLKFLKNNVIEILSEDIKTVIKAKAADAYKKCRVPVIVEHGGLNIEYLNGFPGALSKPMWDLMEEKICTIIPPGQSRKAKAISGVCFCDGMKSHVFISETEGCISPERRGTNGFQWDPIFIPEGETKTYAEMNRTEKLRFSQAAKAYHQLISFLNNNGPY